MSTSGSNTNPTLRKRLPVNPSAEHLKKQAKRRVKADGSLSLSEAQHALAREYGSSNWAELMHVVETMSRGSTQTVNVKNDFEPLPAAANRNDLVEVQRILGEGKFTQHDLDLALARAVLKFKERRAIAELLIEYGADPDGQYGANYGPVVLAPCESLDADGIQFLVDHGADVAFAPMASKYGPQSPLRMVLGTYSRGSNAVKHRCIDILLEHGALVPTEVTPVFMSIHRGRAEELRSLLQAQPALVRKSFREMPHGNMQLAGAALLHMAVEFGEMECVDVLIECGADVNTRADVTDGVGGQSPVFHAIASNQQSNLPMLEHLIHRHGEAIDLSIRATFKLYGEPWTTPVTPIEFAKMTSSEETPHWRRTGKRELELLQSLSNRSR